jgi:SAM-dependent methyltransferase
MRVMLAEPLAHPALLRTVHHFSLQDGSNPEAAAAALAAEEAETMSSVPAGAPPRRRRARKVLDEDDLAALRQKESDHLWRLAARVLQPDLDLMFAHCTLLDAKEAASADRALSQVEGLSTVYGEAAFCSLAAVLARHWRGRGLRKGQGKFVDIGHGSGRALLGAHLLHDFQSIMGVEILRTLVGQSRKVLRRAQTELKEELQRREEQRRRKAVELGVEEEAEEGVSDTATAAAAACSESDGPASLSASPSTGPSFTLLHGDFRDVDFSDADVLFVNSTVFDEDLMHDLSLYARRLKRGSLIVTYTHALKDEEELIDGTDQQHLESVTADGSASQRPPPPPPTRHFRILSDDMFEQSWGWCTVYCSGSCLRHAGIRSASAPSMTWTNWTKWLRRCPNTSGRTCARTKRGRRKGVARTTKRTNWRKSRRLRNPHESSSLSLAIACPWSSPVPKPCC